MEDSAMPKRKRKTQKQKPVAIPRPIDRDRLLYSRTEVSRLLGFSISSIIRFENAGRLKALKLGDSQNYKTVYRASDVFALAGIEQQVA
jgi:hypothetical protein